MIDRTARRAIGAVLLVASIVIVGCRGAPPSGKTPLEEALEAVTAPSETETPTLPPGVSLPGTAAEGV